MPRKSDESEAQPDPKSTKKTAAKRPASAAKGPTKAPRVDASTSAKTKTAAASDTSDSTTAPARARQSKKAEPQPEPTYGRVATDAVAALSTSTKAPKVSSSKALDPPAALPGSSQDDDELDLASEDASEDDDSVHSSDEDFIDDTDAPIEVAGTSVYDMSEEELAKFPGTLGQRRMGAVIASLEARYGGGSSGRV